MSAKVRNITGYISGRVGGPQADQAQALLNEYIALDEVNYYKLMSIAELVDRLGYVAHPNLVNQVDILIARYNWRQDQVKKSSAIDDIKAGILEGWQWLSNKFSEVTGIGAFPIIAVAIIAAVALVSSVIIPQLVEITNQAEQDSTAMDSLLAMLAADPNVKSEDIIQLLTNLRSQQSDDNKDFADKLIEQGGKLLLFGGLAYAAITYGPGLIKKKKVTA